MNLAALLTPRSPVANDTSVSSGPEEGGSVDDLLEATDAAACIVPLLRALGWLGNARLLASAVPHLTVHIGVDDVRRTLANLGYASRSVRVPLSSLEPELLPCLFVGQDGNVRAVVERQDDGFHVFDGQLRQTTVVKPSRTKGTAVVFTPPADGRQPATGASSAWFQNTISRFRGLIAQALLISLITNALTLALPLFVMAIFDWVLPSQSSKSLVMLGLGILFVIGVDTALRLLRARYLAHLGGRLDTLLGLEAFRRIVQLPIHMVERSSIGAQIARLRQFEMLREFFTGPLAAAFLDLPFVVIFVAAVAWIGGPIVWIPLTLIVVFAVGAALVAPVLRRLVSESSEARAQRQNFLVETVSNLRAIKGCAAEETWSRRHGELSAKTAMAHYRASQVPVLVQTASQSLVLVAGVGTIGYSTVRVLDGDMSMGALIACMAIVWRILSPLQVAFVGLLRLEHVRAAISQFNMLMGIRGEDEGVETIDPFRSFRGEIRLNQVSLRYSARSQPAMIGVSFVARPGEVIAITGSSGSGKSSFLKLIAGLYRPQAGTILVDGVDIRQLHTAELRNLIAFVPQDCHLFHGTIAQNLRLANPAASDTELAEAARDAGVLDDILALPDGFRTRLTDELQRHLPSGFKQQLVLARAYVKHAPVYVLDEPAKSLDRQGDIVFVDKLWRLREHATVLFTTHRPSHFRAADRVVCFADGRIVFDGAPDAFLSRQKAAS